MTNYLYEDKRFEIENSFKPLEVKKSTWEVREKRLIKKYVKEKEKEKQKENVLIKANLILILN